jgi:ABC-2 type transport system ATP-binding protein
MAADDNLALKITSVSKDFLLPRERVMSAKGVFVNFWRFLRHDRQIDVQHTLRGVSFQVKKGEFFGIVGKNGSGKSTLLKIMAGIYQPTGGSLEVNGSLVPFIELGVGFNPELTGRENVYLNGALLGFSNDEIDAKYEEIVAFAELEDFMDQRLKNYSSGMQVRLAFSMAVQAQSEILIIDEVLAVGDAAFQRKCFNYFMDLKRHKKTVVLVTHDMEAVRQYCDRAILIKDGVVAAKGDPEKVAQAYIKQFSEQEENSSPFSSPENRWGDGGASYDQPTVKVDEDFVSITTTLKANVPIEYPLLGISIANNSGQRLMGTNTQLCRLKLASFQAGEVRTLEWKIPNIFTSGDYVVGVAAEHMGGVDPLDWWNDAAAFTIQKIHPTPYVVYPKYEVSVVDD